MYTVARPLPPQLVEHVIIYFEEQLCAKTLPFINLMTLTVVADSQALGLLYALAVNQYGGYARGQESFAYIPSTHIIALLATLTVHPTLTTRATSREKLAAADQSLIILEHINQLIGAAGANFEGAFAFAQQHASTGKRKPNKRQLARAAEDASQSVDDSQRQIHPVNLALANQGGLFAKAEDFWHLVGWSFNCSAKYHKRWARWRLWLSFHLSVLEDDLEARLNQQRHSTESDAEPRNPLAGALAVQYFQTIGPDASRTMRRRAMRAVLARGEAKDLTEFPEMFQNELKENKQAATVEEVRARTRVNLDEGDFGDYFDNDDEEDDDDIEVKTPAKRSIPDAPRSSKRKTKNLSPPEEENAAQEDSTFEEELSIIDAWGGSDATQLRLRILVLLTKVASHMPVEFMHLQELLDIFTEFIRPLPIAIFAEITSPPVNSFQACFTPEIYATLAQMLFQSLLGVNKAPKLQYLQIPNQKTLQERYLSGIAASATPADNAKVSLLVEGLLRLAWASPGLLEARLGFKSDLDWGIEMRRAKAANIFSTAKKTRVRNEDAEANAWLTSSEARLSLIGESIQAADEGG